MAEPTNRPTRAEETRRERRRKPGSTSVSGHKLTVDESKLDRKNFEYRFANDDEGRLAHLMANDWDVVSNAKDDTSSGGTVSSAVGGIHNGKPYHQVLLKKHKDWYDEDQKEKMRPLDEMDDAIRRGITTHAGNKELTGQGGEVYTPEGGNRIETRSTR